MGMCGIPEHSSLNNHSLLELETALDISSPALCLTNEETEARIKRKAAQLDSTSTTCCVLYLLKCLNLLRSLILIPFYR